MVAKKVFCDVQYHHQHQKSVRQTTQNNVSIFFSTGSIEELINASIDISENMMQYFLKNFNYVIDCF